MIPSTFASPKIVDRHYKEPVFSGPGPCNYSPSVVEALKKPCVSPLCDEYYNILDDIRAGLQYLFQTRNKLVLAISGAGHAGMEALICNLVAPGETLVIAVRGVWDERTVVIAKRYGINVIEHRIPYTSVFTFGELEDVLKKHQPRALYITHGDSSTGTIQKLDGLGDICHKEVINQRKHEPSFYFDVKILAQQWNCYGDTRGYHHTMSPAHLWALRACLKDICDETLPKVWARQLKVKEHFHKRLQELGFEFLIPNPEDRFTNVTTVVIPKGYDHDSFVRYILEKHNIYIFPGSPLGKLFASAIWG